MKKIKLNGYKTRSHKHISKYVAGPPVLKEGARIIASGKVE